LKTVEERLRSYEPLWENWTYSGEFLGEGAMSSVFEIESTAMGFREVAALKIITVKKNIHGTVEIPREAQNEIRILRDLSNCPNIVHYHDSTLRKIYDDNNNLSEIDILIKMEKLQPLSEDTKLSAKEVTKLATDMCNALAHAAEHNIIHRDIKPQNIFIDEAGTYKLGDFGIAKIVSEGTGRYTMNVGTLAYTAPEINTSPTGKYDISSDIYSLGLVLYAYLNNGCLPFVNSASSLNEAITKRLHGDPFPSPANGNKNLKAIVMRACNKDPNKRYKTPAEMLEDLELLATGGKKMVIDPFATLDANQDLDETSINPEIKVSPTIDIAPIGRSEKKVSEDNDKELKDTTNAGIRLIINMGKKADESASAPPISKKSDSDPAPRKGLISTLKTRSGSDSDLSSDFGKSPAGKESGSSTPKKSEPAPPPRKGLISTLRTRSGDSSGITTDTEGKSTVRKVETPTPKTPVTAPKAPASAPEAPIAAPENPLSKEKTDVFAPSTKGAAEDIFDVVPDNKSEETASTEKKADGSSFFNMPTSI